MRYGAEAVVKLASTPTGARIEVCDSGPGIPESELGNVLRPFYRLEQSRNKDTGGVGLGLAIVNDIASHLNAKLTLKNADSGGLVAALVFSNARAGV